QVSNSFGSPALWDTVTHFCLQHGVKLPSLKRVLLAGAPVPGPLLARFDQILSPEARVFTPYGATEALPVSNIEKREILDVTWARTEQGAGTCVGRPVPGLRVHILPLSDAPIDAWDPGQDLPPGGRGEIAVEAPWVTRDYFQMEKTTRAAKVLKEGGFLHRMGDVGYFDGQGRLWFCGRKNHRVLTPDGPLFTIPCEAVFNRHPAVQRTALVGVGPPGSQKPVLIVELRMPGPSKKKRMALEDEILALGKDHPHTRNIQCVLFHAAFPVDVRHNAKISREVLARWAEKQCAL
ncbi:MAG: AMP-binding protein, partial [Nitrospinaceae bacterium]